MHPKKLKPLTTTNAIPTREARHLAHFSQQSPTITQKVEHAIADYSKKFYTKGNLTDLALGSPSLKQTMTDDAVFDHACLHLDLSYFLSTHEIKSLNA